MTRVCFFISLINKAWWLTLSKALDKSIEHKFAVYYRRNSLIAYLEPVLALGEGGEAVGL